MTRCGTDVAKKPTISPTNTPIAGESALRTSIMECDTDVFILNVLRELLADQIGTGERSQRAHDITETSLAV